MALFFVSWFSVLIALFVLGILVCIWVYRDAERRGMNGAIWLIIVLLTNLVGLIIYLVVRTPEVVRSAQTIQTLPSSAKYCVYCGKPIPSDAKFCSNCGKEQASSI